MSQSALSAARKFWEVFPAVMRTIFAESRRGDNNFTPSQFRILHMLSSKDCSISQLAQNQGVSLPSMSDTVQTLVERGWLERDQSAEDRRVMQVRINRKGQQVLANEHKRLVGLMAERLETLTVAELDQIEKSLASLLSVFGAPSPEKSAQPERASRR